MRREGVCARACVCVCGVDLLHISASNANGFEEMQEGPSWCATGRRVHRLVVWACLIAESQGCCRGRVLAGGTQPCFCALLTAQSKRPAAVLHSHRALLTAQWGCCAAEWPTLLANCPSEGRCPAVQQTRALWSAKTRHRLPKQERGSLQPEPVTCYLCDEPGATGVRHPARLVS